MRRYILEYNSGISDQRGYMLTSATNLAEYATLYTLSEICTLSFVSSKHGNRIIINFLVRKDSNYSHT